MIFELSAFLLKATLIYLQKTMKRIVFQSLMKWSAQAERKPLILRGARQVGKTFVVRELGEKFDYYIEVNFEKMPQIRSFFTQDLDPRRICELLSLQFDQPIIPGKSLLFFDEIQECPEAILALRYFYEELADLHLVAAGSLIDFAIEEIGIPVGRVSFLYLYPLSFIEFLIAAEKERFAQEIINHPVHEPLPEFIHQQLLALLGEYMVTGGMPEVVANWLSKRDLRLIQTTQHELVEAYRQDFNKYAKKNQLKYVELIFNQTPSLISQAFKYTQLQTPYQKRELAPCLDLLVKANIIHKVYHTSGNGVPLGADIDFEKFKLIFVDVGLCESILGLTLKEWILDPITTLVNKGSLCEAFVGQELLAYSPNNTKTDLYYWHRAERSSMAEVDYLIADHSRIIPIEVKSNKGGALKSLKHFLSTHDTQSPYGIRFSAQNYSSYDPIHSYPLYAVAGLFSDNDLLTSFLNPLLGSVDPLK